MAMLIHNFLEVSATKYPDAVAVIHDDARVTYGQLNRSADNMSSHLVAAGIAHGDRVVLLLENCIDYITAYYASLKAGAVSVPLNPRLKPEGLRHLFNELEPAAVITSFKSERLLKAIALSDIPTLKLLLIKSPRQTWPVDSFAVSSIEEVLTSPTNPTNIANPTNPAALASIIYTSGSTGQPKGVMLSHNNIVTNTAAISLSLSITRNDVQMVVLPFFYVMGKSLLNTHIAAGGTVVINNRFMYPADVLNQMIEERVTSFSGVPSTYAYLLNRSPLVNCKDKLTALRYCSQAGGHMATAVKQSLLRALPEHTRVFIMYGATEASARLTCLEPSYLGSKIESIGKPISGVTIKILDAQNQEVTDGREGMLVAQGLNIMKGYWKAPQDTDRVLSCHGYYTGDIGYRDSEGFLYVTGRRDGLIKVSGHRVNPIEIEDVLMATDLLIETAVIGLPDTLMGNRLVALIVPKEENVDIKTLLKLCADSLPGHKCPSNIITLRALPKNDNGKVDKHQCTKLAAAQLAPKSG